MKRRVAIGTTYLALMIAGSAFAGFGASELIYIPVVSHSPGAVGSQWRTDLYITNVDGVAIDVAIAYLPSGFNNTGVFTDRESWLGGREDDGFGLINEALADIPPNGSVVLRDLVGEYWLDTLGTNGNGSLIIFAYEADTLEPDGTRVDRLAIANARIYNETTIWVEDPENPGEFEEEPAEYGQTMPGVPWYNLADSAAVSEGEYDFSFEELTGGEETNDLRYNIGVVNASDPLTTITVSFQPYQANGEPFLDENEIEIRSVVNLAPASHVQLFRPFRQDWGLNDVEGATVQVSIVGWTTGSANPIVMMTSYGSVVNNTTSDPSTVLPTFAYPYDIDCMWEGEPEPGVKQVRGRRRPVEIPSQD